MMKGMWAVPPVHQRNRAIAPRPVPPPRLRDDFFAGIGSLTLGLVRGERWRLRLGPLTLLTFAEPVADADGWTWPITGGLLARAAGGSLSYRWCHGELSATVDGYLPRLPAPLYLAVQVPIHRIVSRRFLLKVRGRLPPPGVPAGPARRLAGASLDLALCAWVVAALRPQRRLMALAGVVTAYHLACWTLGGRTVGGALVGARVVSVDGGPVASWQALLRLLAVPFAARRLRPLHDDLADTEVIEV